MNYSSMKIIFHIIFYIRAVNNLIIIKFNLIFIYNKFFNNNNNKNNKLNEEENNNKIIGDMNMISILEQLSMKKNEID